MNYNEPFFSIVTVCYNAEKTIRKTIESILGQDYQNFEYIIIDGESTDNTVALILEYEDDFCGKLKIKVEKDSGIYNAMNKGISLCKGDIIGIVNSDDYYGKSTLSYVKECFKNYKYEDLIVIGNMVRVSYSGEVICTYKFNKENIQKKQCFGHPSMFVARTVYEKNGVYDESFKLAADGEWQYRAHANQQIKFVLCDKVLNHMREGGASDNSKYRKQWFLERTRMKRMYNKGSIIMILYQETKSLLKNYIKNILPSSVTHKIYRFIK